MPEFRLNEQQIEAVKAPPERPAIVIASPGSGKTAVLTQRVAYLVNEVGADPSRIIVTTFTRRASEEMRDRLVPLIGGDAHRLQMGTIHSVCLRILREEGESKQVISSYDQKKIIQDELGYKKLNWDVGWRYPLNWIMKAKASLIESRKSQDWFYERIFDLSGNRWQAMDLSQKLFKVYKEYEQQKRYLNQMDFADMLMWVGVRFQREPSFKAKWQKRVDYVLVDEVQDTNRLSYEILRTLAEPENRFFAVGDPDQELFKWNGADPEHNVFGFTEMFTDGKVYRLDINYRSTGTIVQTASKVISANYEGASEARRQYQKAMQAAPGADAGVPVSVTAYADPDDEAEGVVEQIQTQLSAGRQPKDIFVVYRTNAQSRAVEDSLLRARLPYVVQGSLGFYERKTVKDMLAYLSLVNDKDDDDSFKRIANIATADFFRATRGLGNQWIHECESLAKGHGESMYQAMLRMKPQQQKWRQGAIEDFVKLIDGVEEGSQGEPDKALSMIRALCYEPYLLRTQGIDQATAQEEGILEDLDELVYAAGKFKTINEFLAHVEFIRQMQAQRSKEAVDAVVLTTIHRVKGLERPVVYGIGMAEKILPHKYAIEGPQDPDGMPVENTSGVADERCAAFVLASRAREELHLSYPMEYRNKPVDRSRFIDEMGLAKDIVVVKSEQEVEQATTA